MSKKEAEISIWNYVKEFKPSFSVTVFLPALIFGPPIHSVKSMDNINYSNNVFYSLFNGTYDVLPPTSFPSYVDVRDLAAAQIASLTIPGAFNKRLLIGGHSFSHRATADILRKIPELAGRVPKDSDEVTLTPQIDPAETNQILAMKYHTAEETFTDAAKKILELEAVLPKHQ
jgi:nucleoside-diphosphate-sugar epimerase